VKKIVLVFVFFFLFSFQVEADGYKNIYSSFDADIFIDSNGDANIVETWGMFIMEDTPLCRTFSNLENKKIEVTQLHDKETLISFSDPFYSGDTIKYEIKKSKEKVNICITEELSHNSHTITFSYKVSNFVKGINDGDIVEFYFLPSPIYMNKLSIKMHSDFNYDDSLVFEIYGKDNMNLKNENGFLKLEAGPRLIPNEEIVFLIKFAKGTFNLSEREDKYFTYYERNLAQQFKKEIISENKTSFQQKTSNVINKIIYLVIVIIFIKKVFIKKKVKYGFEYGKFNKKEAQKTPKSNVLPQNKRTLRNFYISAHYGLVNREINLLGAMVLYWLKLNYIVVVKRDKTLAFEFKDRNSLEFETEAEENLYVWMYKASKDGFLEEREFEYWCKENRHFIFSWFADALNDERKLLSKEGLLKQVLGENGETKYIATEELFLEARKLAGLKKYLKSKPKEINEILDYSVLAHIFGIHTKISEEIFFFINVFDK
jgi:hypothetical protein